MISIIVPLYNTEKYIIQCLQSIAEQTYTNFECIIVNDGSTDNGPTLVNQFIQDDSRFMMISKKNGGVSSTRNCGIEKAKGKYIIFVDADDWIEKFTLEKFHGIAEKYNPDVIVCDYYCDSTSIQESRKAIMGEGGFFENENYEVEFLGTMIGPHGKQLKHPERSDRLTSVWAKMYRTSIIKDNKIAFINLDLVPSECQLFNIDFMIYANNAYYIEEPLYHYRRNTSKSLTKKYRAELKEAWNYYLKLVYKKLGDKINKPVIAESYRNSVAFSVIQLGGNAVKLPGMKRALTEIRGFLFDEEYIKVFKLFNFVYLPIHWKVFFFLAKQRAVFGFFIITRIMRWLMNRRKK